ncbi:MAG: ABC transporter permease [Deltaproteobacteria bacterium]|nr:ABC transporter permease [Deltaproteobacteria bacterium]
MRYFGYLSRRLVGGLLTVLAVISVCFLVLEALPGDPTDMILGETATDQDRVQLRRMLRLDQPFSTRYAQFLLDIVVPARGMGHSLRQPTRSAWSMIVEAWPDTVALALGAGLVAWTLAIPLALIAATRPRTKTDAVVGVVSMLGVAIPSLWLGPLLILAFCVALPWLPFPGPDARGLPALILPSLTLGVGMAGILTRMGRVALRETLREPFIQAARARGLSEPAVLIKHALRAAMVPLLTAGGAQLSSLLGGAIITEKIFDRPGLGTLLLQSLTTRDLPVVLACVVVIAITAVFVQLLVDVAYVLVDPRIRLA